MSDTLSPQFPSAFATPYMPKSNAANVAAAAAPNAKKTLVLKVRCGPDLRKTRLHCCPSFTGLFDALMIVCRLDYSETTGLKYRDSEGDWITLEDDDDLRLAYHSEPSLFIDVRNAVPSADAAPNSYRPKRKSFQQLMSECCPFPPINDAADEDQEEEVALPSEELAVVDVLDVPSASNSNTPDPSSAPNEKPPAIATVATTTMVAVTAASDDQEASKAKQQMQQSSWLEVVLTPFFYLYNTLYGNQPKEMILPDDKEQKIRWDPSLKRYVGEGVEEAEEVVPPPPDLSTLSLRGPSHAPPPSLSGPKKRGTHNAGYF